MRDCGGDSCTAAILDVIRKNNRVVDVLLVFVKLKQVA